MAPLLALWLSSAWGADWLRIQGTEDGRETGAAEFFGFVQPRFDAVVGGKPSGEGGGTPGPGDARSSFRVFRARPGLRGVVPGTDGRVSWRAAAELGSNSITARSPVVPTDLSVTARLTDGLWAQAGQFKMPWMDETLEAIPVAADFATLSEPARQLVLERPVKDGAWAGGSYATRDVGVELFAGRRVGDFAYSGAIALSNGRMGGPDLDDAKDLSARVEVTRVLRGEDTDPHRHELRAFAWRLQGQRDVDGDLAPRVRQGVGLQLEVERVRARVEGVEARGVVVAEPTPDEPARVVSDGRALGGVAQLRVEIVDGLSAMARYDALDLRAGDTRRLHSTATVGVRATLIPKAYLQAEYALRGLGVPEVRAAGDLATVQATVRF